MEEFEEYDIDDDDDSDEDSLFYNCEEKSTTHYNIILCELYNERLHGETSNVNLKSSYLVYCRFKYFDMDYIEDYTDDFNAYYLSLINEHHNAVDNHSVYRNYKNIISKQNYIKPEIAQCVYLENNECVAVLKTYWLRLIQRTWKNIIRVRKGLQLPSINDLKQREIIGQLPNGHLYYPELRGMLANISY